MPPARAGAFFWDRSHCWDQGQQIRDDKGKLSYLNYIEFPGRQISDRFQRDILAALQEQSPELFDTIRY